ncbi:hypothetical protein BX600DRAFT_537138 [Xylariales sp. PMI_506]|nr:hypothetical protein BX600DRAFT_537138 [Xylariales sp. PMI_506]
MSFAPEFGRPEPGFDLEECRQFIQEYYQKKIERHVLDSPGQRAPPVEERIKERIADFKTTTGKPPTEEQEARIEEVTRLNSGWLEGLKIDIAGQKTVPIAAFNRLVREAESVIECGARDRVHYEAEQKEEILRRDDQIEGLKKIVADLESWVKDSETYRCQLEEIIKDGKTHTDQLTAELFHLKDKMKRSEGNAWMNTVDANQRAEVKEEEMRKKVAQAEQSNNALRATNEKLQHEKKSLEVELHRCRLSEHKLQSEKISSLEKENITLGNGIKAAQGDIGTLGREIGNLLARVRGQTPASAPASIGSLRLTASGRPCRCDYWEEHSKRVQEKADAGLRDLKKLREALDQAAIALE